MSLLFDWNAAILLSAFICSQTFFSLIAKRAFTGANQIIFSKFFSSFFDKIQVSQVRNYLLGFRVGALIPSRGTLYSSCISFVNSGLVSKEQAFVFLAGVLLSSKLLIWTLIFEWGSLGFLCFAIGFYFVYYLKVKQLELIGHYLFSIGLLVSSFQVLGWGLATQPEVGFAFFELQETSLHVFSVWIGFSLLGFILGLFFRSSWSALFICMALYKAGYMHTAFVIPVMTGSYFGSIVPSSLLGMKLKTEVAKFCLGRTLCYAVVNILCLIVFFNFRGLINDLFSYIDAIYLLPLVDIAVGLLFLIFTIPLFFVSRSFVAWLVQEPVAKENQKLLFIGSSFQSASSLMRAQATQEVKKSAMLVSSMFEILLESDQKNDNAEKKLERYSKVLWNIDSELNDFFRNKSFLNFSDNRVFLEKRIMGFSDNLAQIGNSLLYCYNNLSPETLEFVKKQKNIYEDKVVEQVISTNLIPEVRSNSIGFTDSYKEERRIKSLETFIKKFN